MSNRWQAIIWTKDGLFYRRIYMSLNLNELKWAAVSKSVYMLGLVEGCLWPIYGQSMDGFSRSDRQTQFLPCIKLTSNGSWCMGIKGEMSGMVCVTFTILHEICIYIWVVYSLCFFCCLFITVTWWYVWCFEWASGNQEEVQACLVTLWLFIISCYSLYKTTLGLLCSWFENNPHFHKYSMDFHV